MTEVKKKKSYMAWWPDVKTEDGLRQAIAGGYWGSYVVAAITLLFVALKVVGPEALWDAAIIGIAGFFIQYYKSRTAAVIAFAIFVLGKIVMAMDGAMADSNWIIAIIIAIVLFHGIRGTFAYQSKKKITK